MNRQVIKHRVTLAEVIYKHKMNMTCHSNLSYILEDLYRIIKCFKIKKWNRG